jgi:predicted ATPase
MLQIKSIRIINFKSIADATIKLEGLTCLVGLNGAGKTTVLEAITFLGHLVQGTAGNWLAYKGCSVKELSGGRKKIKICYQVMFQSTGGETLTWQCAFDPKTMRCSSEAVTETTLGTTEQTLFKSDGQTVEIAGKGPQRIEFNFEGSIFSKLIERILPEQVAQVKNALIRISSLELSPATTGAAEHYRGGALGAADAQGLPGFLKLIKGAHKAALLELAKQFYPSLTDFKTTTTSTGLLQLFMLEKHGTLNLKIDSRQASAGLLKILALLPQVHSNRKLVLFDEIENSLNPEALPLLVSTLQTSRPKVLVTTHSALLLNYLEDELARKAVHFVYKSPNGETRVRLLFEIARIADKLQFMGPGEAFADTDLRALTKEGLALDDLEQNNSSSGSATRLENSK